MPPASSNHLTSSFAKRGESTSKWPPGRSTKYECAPNDERALKPQRHTLSVIGSGKILTCGRGCFVSLRTDAVGQTSTARQAASCSSDDTGCRANTLLPPRATIRSGATWRDAPQSIHAVSMYQSPGAESGLRVGFIAEAIEHRVDGRLSPRIGRWVAWHLGVRSIQTSKSLLMQPPDKVSAEKSDVNRAAPFGNALSVTPRFPPICSATCR